MNITGRHTEVSSPELAVLVIGSGTLEIQSEVLALVSLSKL